QITSCDCKPGILLAQTRLKSAGYTHLSGSLHCDHLRLPSNPAAIPLPVFLLTAQATYQNPTRVFTMKIISSAVFGSLAIGSVSAILGGQIVPQGSKTYNANLRLTADGNSVCGGALISPDHVLTAASCMGQGPAYVAVGTHYVNGTKDGEQIKIASSQQHPKFYGPNLKYDLAVLTLEKPSKFSPVQLPKSDDTDLKLGVWTTSMGWGSANPAETFEHSEELRSVELGVWKNEDCRKATNFTYIDRTYVCAGGIEGKGVSFGDQGGPLIKENNPGDADDVLVGVLSYAVGHADKGKPSVYTRVSTALEWINSFVKSQ
ncbi:hypothetical protein L914_07193, partial [Phytophthora nicotianae]